MAIYGKGNIIAAMNAHKAVFWKVFETQQKKEAGNFVAAADFSNPELGLLESSNQLQSALDRMTPGRYLMTCYDKPESKRGGIDTAIEIEVNPNNNNVISGVNNSDGSAFYMEGIGEVNAKNIGDVIAIKIKETFDKKNEEQRIAGIEAENIQLKKELKENDGAVNRGLMAVGTVAYATLSKTPAFKEMMGTIGSVMSAIPKDAPAAHLGSTTEVKQEQLPDNHIEGDTAEIGGTHVNQSKLFETLDLLGKDNPDVLKHLEILAKLKVNNPTMYNEAVDMAESM